MSFSSDASEFMAHHFDSLSKTLPRNYNNSSMSTTAATGPMSLSHLNICQPVAAAAAAASKPIGHLEYFDLDHSNPPPICQNNAGMEATKSTKNLVNHHHHSHHQQRQPPPPLPIASGAVAGGSSSSSSKSSDLFQKVAPPIADLDQSGIVYKSVDFIKTEAIKRTRQDRAQNHSLFE